MKDGERSFTKEDSTLHIRGGRYTGTEPQQAALKAGKVVLRKLGSGSTRDSVVIALRETTQGTQSTNRVFYYEVRRKRMQPPVVMSFNGKSITVNFQYESRSIDSLEFETSVKRTSSISSSRAKQ
jgi:hypothetical protein